MIMRTTFVLLLAGLFLGGSLGVGATAAAQEPAAKKRKSSTTKRIKHLEKEAKELRDENRRLKDALDSLKATVGRLEKQVESLGKQGGTLAIRDGAVLEYGSVLFDPNRKYHVKKIKFRNEYKSPPLVIVCESGTAGGWVVAKSQRITTKQAEIAVRDEFWYRCRIGYIVIGEGELHGASERGKAPRKAERKQRKRPAAKGETTKQQQERGKVNRGVLHTESGENVLVAATKADHERVEQLFIAEDEIGVNQMLLEGRIWEVRSGTKCVVIRLRFLITEIRVLEGPHAGQSGWVPTEFVQLVRS